MYNFTFTHKYLRKPHILRQYSILYMEDLNIWETEHLNIASCWYAMCKGNGH